MDDTQRRQMQDQHGRDEAQMRRSQQQAAGRGHPVQAYPPHGEASALPHTTASADALVRAYDDAVQAERDAWSGVPALPGEPGYDGGAWDRWRATVEARDKATRLLINHAMGSQP
ncbi:hypothetical protein [Ramlibacter humi]|uniref:Uncharacterized protein n=1 Tax=Ramlibacter humi TaxID=2530451 RepID=A0A4Z0C8B2_9BURK|nr:hypothetical protein [Ramlibacter humi]TFZ07927.1 hypothetical protein EZ216_01820 [Ramlibacter humi]